MKKILKSISKFFLGIWNFVDKIIILPITKLVLKLTNGFDKSGKAIENWLSKKNTLLFISLFMAVVAFIVIDRQIVTFSKNSAEVLRSLPVKVIYNEEAYVVDGLPETVDITLIGSKTDLFIAKQISTYDVTIDLTGLKPGQHEVGIKYNQASTNLEYMVIPSTVNVTISDKVSQTKNLSVDLLNQDKLDPKLVITNAAIESDKVVIKGSRDQLEKVAIVKALLDIDSLVEQKVGTFVVEDVELKAYDSRGNIINVEIVPETIDVTLTIESPSKEVAVKIIPKGTVAFGKAISSIESNVSKVTLYGDNSKLEELNYITLEVDVNDLKEDKNYKLDIPKPVGVTYMSANSVNVSVSLDTVSEVDLNNVRVVFRNLAEGYSVSAASTSDASVTVNLKGVSKVIDKITVADVVAYIDLEGLTEGTHEVEVKIEGNDSKVTYTSKTKKVKVTITK